MHTTHTQVRSWFAPGYAWELFNLTFICFFQQLVVLAFTSPVAAAAQATTPLGTLDLVAAALCVCFVVGEATADRRPCSRRCRPGLRAGRHWTPSCSSSSAWSGR